MSVAGLQTCRPRDRLRAAPGVLVAVDQHAGQPARRLRRHLHGAVPDPGPRLLRLVRRSRRRPPRARRGRLLARRRGDDRPARAAAHAADRAGVDRRLRRAARLRAAPGRHRRRRLPRRHGEQRLPARRAGDDGGHRAGPRTASGPSPSTTGPSTSGSPSPPRAPGSSPSTATSPASSVEAGDDAALRASSSSLKLPESRPEQTARGAAGGSGEDEVGLGTVLRDGRFMGVVGLSFLVALIFQQGYVGLPVAMGAAGLHTRRLRHWPSPSTAC